MSYFLKTLQNATWFAILSFVSQAFSWCTTLLIARILLPQDYGLMAVTTIFTGYAAMFCELGVGASIIQKKEITKNELSSVFWMVLGIGILIITVAKQ